MKDIVENLIEALTRLPGVGRKTAQRYAYYILSMPREEALDISKAIEAVKEKIRFCKECFNITDQEYCRFCRDQTRDRRIICVVEEPVHIQNIERTNSYRGLYHVLHGSLSPVDGIRPEDLKIKELKQRIQKGEIKEVIIATNPNTKGELTAQFIRDLLLPFKVRISRIAYGLPMGGAIDFADEVTLSRALEGRIPLNGAEGGI